jgi:exosortase A-associated hydrolase 2
LKPSCLTAEFIDGVRGPILVTARKPAGARRCVLFAPPFAEEMNKSRRMMAETSIALAARGYASVLPDLFGSGDSAGEFVDADWATWVQDMTRVVRRCEDSGLEVSAVVAVRLGCALAAQALRECGARVHSTVFWQPVTDGARFMAQFLRLRVAASMMSPEGAESIGQLKQQLQERGRLEVAGYELSSKLVADIDGVRLDAALGPQLGDIHWLEVVRDASGEMPGAARASVQRAQDSGHRVHAGSVVGEPFWSSTEIVLNPALIDRTIEVLAA